MQFSAMKSYIRRIFGWDVNDTDQTLSIEDALNSEYMLTAGMYDWPWLKYSATEAVTNVSTTIDLSAFRSVSKVVAYSTSQTYSLIEQDITLWMLDNGHPSLVSRSRPVVYSIGGVASGANGLFALQGTLLPYPDGAYTIWKQGIRAVPEMSADADVPFFPFEYHRVVPVRATVNLMNEEGFNPQLAQRLEARGEALLAGLIQAREVARDTTATVVRVGA